MPDTPSPRTADILAAITFDADGLVPAIAQQHDTGEVLMLAWMNRDAVAETLATGRVCYFSRSRARLWRKGETSGQVQHLRELRIDCDGDALLLLVDQTGVACHTGRRSCFYRAPRDGELVEIAAPLVPPEALYPRRMTLLYLVAGEQSGDEIGARLMAALARQRPDLSFAGIGGAEMVAQGLESRFPLEQLALMGFLEVLPRLHRLRRLLTETDADIAALRPAVVVTIDSPGFTLRLLRRVAATGIRRVHYVAPQVWAWRPGRMRHYPGLWDRLLCLLPFEPTFFARYDLPATFVGHPVLESGADRGDAARFHARHAVPSNARVITVMPGSRRTETARLLPILGAALDRLTAAVPNLRPVVPVAGPVADPVRAATRNWATEPVLVTEQQDKHDAFAASAAALTKSGTSTLELALAGVPMLVTYRVNPLSAALARRLLKVRHASLLNLLSQRELVPELLQEACTPARLADALHRLLSDPAAAAAQRQGFRSVLEALRPPAGLPSEAAAAAVLELLDQA